MAGEALTAAALIAHAEAAGVRMRLGEDGALELEAARPPSPALLAALRARRDEVRAALVAAAHSELPPAWLAAMRRRAEAGRARIERHNCTDVAVFEPLAGEPDDAPGLIASALPAAIRIAEAAAPEHLCWFSVGRPGRVGRMPLKGRVAGLPTAARKVGMVGMKGFGIPTLPTAFRPVGMAAERRKSAVLPTLPTIPTEKCDFANARAAGAPADDPDALARRELAAPTGPGAGYRPGDADPLAEGLLVGGLDAPRLRRLATFQRAPVIHVTGWRVAAAVRAAGAEVALDDHDRVVPRGFGTLPEALREHARANAEALRIWLRLERAAGARAPEARPPYGTRPSPLIEGRDFCVVCGPPVPGTVAVWWRLPHTGWRCSDCCEPPDPREDDRVVFAYGASGGPLSDEPAPSDPHRSCAPRAAPGRLRTARDGD